jgi:serine O-acetyltransferase
MVLAQISIGDPVVVQPGVYIVHGQVVIDGLVEVGSGAVISPFVTIGLRAGDVQGATIEPGVSIGTGAKVIGPVTVGAGATIGANAVVVGDVAPGATVVGVPATSTRDSLTQT